MAELWMLATPKNFLAQPLVAPEENTLAHQPISIGTTFTPEIIQIGEVNPGSSVLEWPGCQVQKYLQGR
jgi:hypothetical protein